MRPSAVGGTEKVDQAWGPEVGLRQEAAGAAQVDRGAEGGALDGRLDVDSPPGAGTTVRAAIPCG